MAVCETVGIVDDGGGRVAAWMGRASPDTDGFGEEHRFQTVQMERVRASMAINVIVVPKKFLLLARIAVPIVCLFLSQCAVFRGDDRCGEGFEVRGNVVDFGVGRQDPLYDVGEYIRSIGNERRDVGRGTASARP